ncbi:MAG: hypothetical protein M1495_06475 [Bacteroidetes bacterium]|nr:hypothetical protein [Bacteroidota bacterium]
MKTIAYLLTAILIVLISTSCSSGTYEIKEFVNEVPEWYINPPASTSDVWYEPGTETSLFLDGALDDARTMAESKIATKVKELVDVYTRNIRDELKTEPEVATRFVSLMVTIKTSVPLSGVSIIKRAVMKEKNGYKGFVLAEYPVGEIKKNLLEKVNEEETLAKEIRKTKMFQDLKKEVDDYINWEKEHKK